MALDDQSPLITLPTGEILPPAQQSVAQGYDVPGLLNWVQQSPPATQQAIMGQIAANNITDPNQIAGIIDTARQQAIVAGPVVEQAAEVHPFAGLALPEMPKLPVVDLGATTAALANDRVQIAAGPDVSGPDLGNSRST